MLKLAKSGLAIVGFLSVINYFNPFHIATQAKSLMSSGPNISHVVNNKVESDIKGNNEVKPQLKAEQKHKVSKKQHKINNEAKEKAQSEVKKIVESTPVVDTSISVADKPFLAPDIEKNSPVKPQIQRQNQSEIGDI